LGGLNRNNLFILGLLFHSFFEFPVNASLIIMKSKYVVIMAGGIGSRFWPVSKSTYPKQFLDILGTGKTLIQQTFDRFRNVCPVENVFVVTNEAYRDIVKSQLPELADYQILGEPVMRNTAPCIAYASFKILKLDPLATIIVTPADHLILKEEKFEETILECVEKASEKDYLITLGIVPTRPDTGYGYIQFNDLTLDSGFYKVKTFTEKPNAELASTFLKSGDFLWNAGIFIWSAASIIKAFEKHLPDILEIFKDGKVFYNTSKEQDFIKQAYVQCTNISIDYGIMEKANNVYVIPGDFGWSDLGTWGSVYTVKEKDEAGNTFIGSQKVMVIDSTNCIVNVPENKLVILQGMDDYIVVESLDTLLICKKEKEQLIKQIVADVKQTYGERYV